MGQTQSNTVTSAETNAAHTQATIDCCVAIQTNLDNLGVFTNERLRNRRDRLPNRVRYLHNDTFTNHQGDKMTNNKWITTEPPRSRKYVWTMLDGELRIMMASAVSASWKYGSKIPWHPIEQPEPYVAQKRKRREYLAARGYAIIIRHGERPSDVGTGVYVREVLPGDPDPDRALAFIERIRELSSNGGEMWPADLEEILDEFDALKEFDT